MNKREECRHPLEERRWFRLPFSNFQLTINPNTPKKFSTILLRLSSGVISLSFIMFLVHISSFLTMKDVSQRDICPKNNSFLNDSFKIPALVWYTSEVWWIPFNRRLNCKNEFRSFECDVFRQESQPDDVDAFLFYAGYTGRFPLPRNPETIWALVHDETPINRLAFMYEEGLNLFNFSATFSRFSDFPMPLIWMTDGLEDVISPFYYVNTSKKNALLSIIAPVLYMQSNCDTSTERDAYLKELMKYIKVDSYGVCLRNKQLPLPKMYINQYGETDTYMSHLYGEEVLKFIARYKFIIAIENAVCDDYLTEKFWRAISVGAVPIYFGSPLIRDWLPNMKSAILLEDFPTPELLIQHLNYLLKNDTAYEEYLEHKTLGVISNEKLIDEVLSRPDALTLSGVVNGLECLVCERLHNRSRSVNMMTKKHYNCPLPTSALTLSVNPKNKWLKLIDEAKVKVDGLYEEIIHPNRTRRKSNTTWSW